MSLGELVTEAARAGFAFDVRDGELVVRPAGHALPAELDARLAPCRDQLVTYLAGASEAPDPAHEPAVSFAQERLWFLARLRPQSAAYNIASAMRFEGDLRLDTLERCLGTLVHRHPALRTYFVDRLGRPVPQLVDRLPIDLRPTDLSRLEGQALEATLRGQMSEIAGTVFELERPPLWRWRMLRLGPKTHLLLFAIHHIIADGWSVAVALRELSKLYGLGERGGGGDGLGPPPLRYTRFASWQRGWMHGAVRERELAWWRGALEGFLTPLRLATDRPRPAIQSGRGDVHRAFLDRPEADSLRAFARAHGISLFMLFFAAFGAQLHRHSGQSRFALGTAVSNRDRAELHDVFGFFVNWLPLRYDGAGDPSFAELLARCRAVALDAYRHQDLPFEQLVEGLGLPRDLSRHPVFQTMLVFHVPPPEMSMEGARCSVQPLGTGTAKVDLTLFVTENRHLPMAENRGLLLELEYDSDLFTAPTVERFMDGFLHLLRHACAHPASRVRNLPVLTPEERQRVVVSWNETKRPGILSLLHEEIAAQARQTPDAPAVLGAEGATSYRELDQRSSALAAWLVAEGVRLETAVGLVFERSAEWLVALLGVLKAGGTCVPLSPSLPPLPRAQMAADAGASLILLGAEAPAVEGARNVPLADIRPPAKPVALPTPRSMPPQALAYIAFTSGSTGRPKPVGVSHRNVVNFCRWLNRHLGSGGHERVLHRAPIGVDAAVRELFAPLMAGAAVVPAVDTEVLDAAALDRLLDRHEVTAVHLVPSLLQELLSQGLRATSVRHLVCGGEAMSSDLAREVRELFGERILLHNLYGPTETTVDSTAWRLEHGAADGAADDWAGAATVPIGRPIDNTSVYVLDAEMQPVPVGTIGELYVGGDGVARGYLARPADTAEVFVPDPFAGRRGARLYRTGDFVRWLPCGALVFEGRRDRQIKIRGHRVEPAAIAAVLTGHPAVRQAVVSQRGDGAGKRLVAYLVLDSSGGGDGGGGFHESIERELKERAAQHLPAVMVPAATVVVPRIPLTARGKVDHAALLELEVDGGRSDAAGEAPRGELEQTIASVFQDLLEIPRVGRSEDFFELGGHSLLATQVTARLRRSEQIELEVHDLFEAPTVAALAARVISRLGSPGETQDPGLRGCADAVDRQEIPRFRREGAAR